MIKLSTCLILRDEGTTIYKCLDSCKHITDEFIVGIDTITTDNTKEEVVRFFHDNQNLKHEIYDSVFNESFSNARNIGMDKATGDYIMIIDGHEYFPETYFNITENREIPIKSFLSEWKKKQTVDADEIFFHLYQQPFIGKIPNNYFLQPRVYRNGKGDNGKMIRYGRASHNVIQNTNPEKSSHFPEIILIHDAPDSNRKWRKEQRIKMNTTQLTADLEKNSKDHRALFYLGNTHLEATRFYDAMDCYEKYIALKKPNTAEKYQVYYHWALALKEIDDKDGSIDMLYKAMRIDPSRRDAYILAGDLCMESDLVDDAIHLINNALMIKPQITRMFSDGNINTWKPFEMISRAYEMKGDLVNAGSHLKMALRFIDVPEWHEKLNLWAKDKINILVIDAIGTFSKPIVDSIKADGHNVITINKYDNKLASWADLIWQEWGDSNLMSNQYLFKTVLRIHGYEAYLNQDILKSINPEHLKAVVCVAKHIQDMIPAPTSKLVYNGVDCKSFYDKKTSREKDTIGCAGLMNVKKNPMRLAQIIKDFKYYNFHLRITWQDPFLQEAFKYETRDCKNIIYHGYYDDLNDFWNKVQYVISTSDIESFSYNIAEAMACNCIPLIYNWKGANDIWPEEYIFKSNNEIRELLKMRHHTIQRKFILEKYEQKKQIKQFKDVLYG